MTTGLTGPLSASQPIFIVAAQVLATSVTLGFTGGTSIIRQASLPLVASLTAALVTTLRSDTSIRSQWASALCGTSVLLLFQHVDLAFLARRQYRPGDNQVSSDGTSKTASQTAPTSFTRLAYGFRETTSFRHVDAVDQVKNVPPFSANVPQYVPPKFTFIWRGCLRLACCALFVDITDTFAPTPEEAARTLSPNKIPLLTKAGAISFEAFATRFGSTVGFFTTLYCVAHLTFYPIAITTVVLGLSSPTPWRPLFDSPAEARSVRLFWGKFWHQNMRRPLSSCASLLTNSLLHLPRRSLVGRYIHLVSVFAFSGFLHAMAHIAGRASSRVALAAFQFFVTQAVGIMVEDGFVALYQRWITPEGRRTRSSMVRAVETIGAYAWVLLFLTWSAPIWFYNAAQEPPEEPFLPFSVLKRLT